MKIRAKIASTVMSMALALSVMAFAVWAAATQTLSITNTVSFVSDHVLASIVGEVEGAVGDNLDASYTGEVGSDDRDDGALEDWAIGDVNFENENQDITITITITNNSLERSLSFELTQLQHDAWNGDLGETNITRTVTYVTTNSPVTSGTYEEGAIELQAEQVATIVIALSITDTGKSVNSFNNAFTLTLRNIANYATPVGGFVFDDSDNTILVPQGTTLAPSNLPEMTDASSPAYYGLYKDALYQNKITLPYRGKGSAVYARFETAPAYLNFVLIAENTEYGVNQNGMPSGHIEVPEKFNNLPITALLNAAEDYGAFDSNPGIESVVLPDTITDMGSYTFYEASNLTSINIPKNVTEIGRNAFYKTGLSEITIPNSVTAIKESAFAYTNLSSVVIHNGVTAIERKAFFMPQFESVTIPKSVTYIGAEAFASIDSLEDVTTMPFDNRSANKTFTSSNLSQVLFEANSKLEIIDSYAFALSKIEHITIPASVKTISRYAFANISYYNTGIDNIISERYLQSVTFEENSQLGMIFPGAFQETLITELVLPEGLKVLYNSWMPELEQIELPDSLLFIYHGLGNGSASVFSDKITSLSLPSNFLYYFGSYANANQNITSVVFNNIDVLYSAGDVTTNLAFQDAMSGSGGFNYETLLTEEWLSERSEILFQNYINVAVGTNLETITALSASKTMQEAFVQYIKTVGEAKAFGTLTLKVDAELVSAYTNHADLAQLITNERLVIIAA